MEQQRQFGFGNPDRQLTYAEEKQQLKDEKERLLKLISVIEEKESTLKERHGIKETVFFSLQSTNDKTDNYFADKEKARIKKRKEYKKAQEENERFAKGPRRFKDKEERVPSNRFTSRSRSVGENNYRGGESSRRNGENNRFSKEGKRRSTTSASHKSWGKRTDNFNKRK